MTNDPLVSSPDELADVETRVLDIRVHGVTRAQAAAWITTWIEAGVSAHVATVNAEFVMRAQHDITFRNLLENTDLNVADGMGIVLAARLRRSVMPQRVTGVDLAHDLAAVAAKQGYTLMLVGGSQGVAKQASIELQRQHPNLKQPVTHIGRPDESGDLEARKILHEFRPNIVLVAYGAPLQEMWIARNIQELQGAVAIGVGGALDYISGRTPRAPAAFRQTGLEWAYRLYQEPWRWRRMRVLPLFAWYALLEAIRHRAKKQ
jgi:N-acetylglucosaminyldiphosphoundecaprenol N-acetyl-beta-D-mannosaminyltransferase